MGLTDDYRTGYPVPAEVDGHRLWYAGAVGTEGLTAEVVLERAADAGADVADAMERVRERTRTAGEDEAADDGEDEEATAAA
jgi:sirohydrochlorin cobaltochelatase